ncbi:MAG: glycosyltransferase family 1 protein [Elusimicrobiota bacterium]|nr:glycosyltransferase family 1 protein [Elusimicrobiota bacterium]
MKIGIDAREFFKGKMTGIGRFISNFILHSSVQPHTHPIRTYPTLKFVLFVNQNTKFEITFPENVSFKVINEYITPLWDQIQLPYYLQKENCDLLFSPYYKLPLLCKIPTVNTIHDLTFIVLPEYSKRAHIYKNLAKLYAFKSKKIITVSEYSKSDIIRILGIEPEKIAVVYGSVGRQFYPQQNYELLKTKYRIKKPYILYVGNFNLHKNVQRLIQAYILLPTDIRNEYCLVLAGGNIHNLQLTTYDIRTLRYVPEEDLPVLYSSAELFVFPSLYEGFGLPPLEAMACGCPVVSSNTSSMPEVLGDACLYFNPYDVKEMSWTILRVLENESIKNELKQRGLERVKFFTVENMTKNLLDVFHSLID